MRLVTAAKPLYEARLAGWLEGYHSRDAEIVALKWTADRIYTELCRRTGKPFEDPNRPSYAQLEATRAAIYAGNR